MRTSHIHMDREEDSLPVEMLASLCEARGWSYDYAGDDEITVEIQGSWATYQLRGIWRPEDHVLQLICLPDIRIPDDKRAPMYEVLALVNEQMWLGHFDVWSNGMVLLYRHAILLGDDGMLSLAQAQTTVEAALDECDRFYPAFQFILWGDKSPADALASALVDAAGEA